MENTFQPLDIGALDGGEMAGIIDEANKRVLNALAIPADILYGNGEPQPTYLGVPLPSVPGADPARQCPCVLKAKG